MKPTLMHLDDIILPQERLPLCKWADGPGFGVMPCSFQTRLIKTCIFTREAALTSH